MNNAGAKNKFVIRHYNGHMILGFSCKLNFEGEKNYHALYNKFVKFKYLLCQIHADLLECTPKSCCKILSTCLK
jgi:hypothetical protein